jgi:hypothetical protein
MKKKIPLLLIRIINRFERSCGTVREGRGKPVIINDTRLVCPKILYIYIIFFKNDHGMDVSIIMAI